jgi:hypothetical protein
MKICSNEYTNIYGPKSKTTEILVVFIAFKNNKKVEKESFITARIGIRPQTSGSGYDQKSQDLTGSGSATLLLPPPLPLPELGYSQLSTTYSQSYVVYKCVPKCDAGPTDSGL